MAQIYHKAFFGSEIIEIDEARLSIASSAVLYGLSVYTVFPVCRGAEGRVAFRIESHFKRLLDSARIMGIDSFEKEWTEESFCQAVRETVAANAVQEDVFVRASVHVDAPLPGTRSRGLSTTVSIFVYEAVPIAPQDGMHLKTSVWRRIPDYAIPSRAKVNGAYVNSVLAKQDALDSGYDDCIFLDTAGHVCELSAANIFIVRDGVLSTPSTSSDILEGINRRSVLAFAQEMGIPTVERSIDLTELYIADEVFACGTSTLIAPVIGIDLRVIGGGVPGVITKRMAEKHRAVLHGEDPLYMTWLTKI